MGVKSALQMGRNRVVVSLAVTLTDITVVAERNTRLTTAAVAEPKAAQRSMIHPAVQHSVMRSTRVLLDVKFRMAVSRQGGLSEVVVKSNSHNLTQELLGKARLSKGCWSMYKIKPSVRSP